LSLGTQQREKVENDLIFRKLKGLLNKLTFENYPKLSEQIMALPITTNMRLKGAIYIVFDKALDEPTFATMYAKLCTLMSKWEVCACHRRDYTCAFDVTCKAWP
jgi:translation initiation factor 4G